MTVRDHHSETTDALLAELSADTIGAHLKPVVPEDAVLLTNGNRAYEAFAAATDITQLALVTSKRTIGCYHIQDVNACQSRFMLCEVRFKDVAYKYLLSYLAGAA